MDKGIYTALSGGIAKSHELELIANNLANANTTGFKRDTGTFNEYLTEFRRTDNVEAVGREITAATLLEGRPTGDKSFVEMDGIYTDFRQADLARTGRDLDVALVGKGFFEVLTPSGVRYTRQGNFSINADGVLVTANGFPVLARTREFAKNSVMAVNIGDTMRPRPTTAPVKNLVVLERPPEQRIIRPPSGHIEVSKDGILFVNNRRVAIISIQDFKEQQWLEKVGNAYFKNERIENLVTDSLSTQSHQYFLEGSNVNPVREMTKLIEVSRAYESHMQAIKTYQEIDGKTVNDIVGGR